MNECCQHCGAARSQIQLSTTKMPAIWTSEDGTDFSNRMKLHTPTTTVTSMFCCVCRQCYFLHVAEEDDEVAEAPFFRPPPYCCGVY